MIRIDTEVVEKIITVLIFLTISLTFILKPEEEVKEEFVINEDSFHIFPATYHIILYLVMELL